MKINFKNIIFFLVPGIVLILFYISLNQNKYYDTEQIVGKKISSFELKYLDSNNKLKDSDLTKNNFTLINIWSSWCLPCRQEHHFLIRLKNNSSLKLLGLNFKDKKIHALKFLNSLGNPYHYVVKDNDGTASIKLGAYGVPESILINKDLYIIKKFVGPLNKNDYNEIIEILDEK